MTLSTNDERIYEISYNDLKPILRKFATNLTDPDLLATLSTKIATLSSANGLDAEKFCFEADSVKNF